MGYTALYRKFRPITFSEIVGQEHITRTLRNQIIAGRVGHAYLFNGGRGTGKTSAAKILARAINCLNPKDGEPCNECEICKGAINGSLTDIVEMDAASNNSVEDIRSIREEVNFLPTKAKYRVYIIDEVHMLSTGAFNALLKTLEEPPEHVKFILATTEPQKLPATILSRCQRFDFKKILNIVCEKSNIEITKEALNIIAVLSEGAMRDALSILERCIQDGENKIDEDKIKDLVGIPKITYIHQLTESILEYDVDKALANIDEVLEDGKDILHLCLSSGISGSINSAMIAKSALEEEFPDRKIYVLDSLAASSGFGLLMDKVADLRDEGMSIDELKDWVEANKRRVNHWFFSTDLTFYIKGGRVSKTAGFFGGILGICPLLNVDLNGKLIPRAKVKGKRKSTNLLSKSVDFVARLAGLEPAAYCLEGSCSIQLS